MSLHSKHAKKRREELEKLDDNYAKLVEITREIDEVTQLIKKGVKVEEAFAQVLAKRKTNAENVQNGQNENDKNQA